jgi:ABC-2 type transport system permease protein
MRLKRRLDVNPIIVKELRSRMRGARAFVMLTGVLLLLGGVSYALYRIVLATSRYSASPLSPQIGQALFSGLVFLELMMVCFITPAVTTGSISGEREKLTYEMLLATPLRPTSILWGKLFSSLSYVFLLIFAAVPMASLVFIFGGVTPRDMIKSFVVLVVIAVTLGVIGIFMSAWLGRTARATVLTYLVVLALLVGPLFILFLVGVLRQEVPPRWILVPSPASALFSALTSSSMPSGGASAGLFWSLGMILGGDLRMIAGPGSVSGIPRPLYHYTLPLYGVGTLVLYLLTTRLIRPTRRWRIGWKEVAVAVALLLIFGGVVALAFFSTTDRYEKVSILAVPTPVPGPAIREVVVPVEVPPPVPTPTPATLPTVALADQSAIYVAVVRQLYTVDHTFDEPPNFPAVYLVRATDDGVGDPDAPRTGSQVLPETVQMAVVEALADLPADFLWVDDANEVPREEKSGTVKDRGAIFTLGNIHLQADDSALVSATLYFSALGAGGKTFVLQQVDGIWQVTGDTGVQWIS